MSIEFKKVKPREVQSDSGKTVYVTHAIKIENKENYFLLTDYDAERPALYAAQLDEDEQFVPVSEELADAIMASISNITLPDFPSREDIKEAVLHDRTI